MLTRLKNGKPTEQSSTLEFEVSSIGITRYHYKLLLICGLGQIADAAEIIGISFVIPKGSGLANDMEFGDGAFNAHISAALFFGMLFGGYIFGALADDIGRRRLLIFSMSINFSCGMLSACVWNKYALLFARFFSGVGAGGAIPITFVYYIEFFGSKTRERWLVYLSNFWCVGSAFVALMGYVALPERRHFTDIGRWRVFFFLISLPALAAVISLLTFADDSPKFLLQQQKMEELEKLLIRINGGKLKQVFNKNAVLRYTPKTACSSPGSWEKSRKSATNMNVFVLRITKMVKNTKVLLFEKTNRRNSVGLVLIYFCFSFSYYGWLTFQPTYAQGVIGEKIYFEALLGAVAQLAGSFLTLYLINKLDAGFTLRVSCYMSAGVMVLFPFWSLQGNITENAYYILWSLFSFTSVAGWQALNILQGEAFKTNIRGTASGFNNAIGRLGSMVGTEIFGIFGTKSNVPLFICGVLFLVAAKGSRILNINKGKEIE